MTSVLPGLPCLDKVDCWWALWIWQLEKLREIRPAIIPGTGCSPQRFLYNTIFFFLNHVISEFVLTDAFHSALNIPKQKWYKRYMFFSSITSKLNTSIFSSTSSIQEANCTCTWQLAQAVFQKVHGTLARHWTVWSAGRWTGKSFYPLLGSV